MQVIQAPRASAILYAMLLRRGDLRPWLIPANICPIVTITFLKAGVPFELVDISAETLQMDVEQAERLISSRRYGGLLYAHTYGESSTPTEFFRAVTLRQADFFLLDDRCLCLPDLDPIPAAVHGTMYSTGYAKIVDLSSGGYAFFQDGTAYEPARLSFDAQDLETLEKTYKRAVREREMFVYHDSDWLETESARPAWYDYRKKIEQGLKESLEQRRVLNAIYAENLPLEIQLGSAYQNWRFNIRVPDQARVLKAIFSAGFFASAHYASLAGIMAEGRAPVAERLAAEVINLFNDHHFTAEMALNTCAVVKENLA